MSNGQLSEEEKHREWRLELKRPDQVSEITREHCRDEPGKSPGTASKESLIENQ